VSFQNTLTVKGYGVVCRVNPLNRCAWLWNDHIGRVYVNNSDYTRADDFAPMQSFDVVDFSVTFKGAFEGSIFESLPSAIQKLALHFQMCRGMRMM
jgi:hypothetical protein